MEPEQRLREAKEAVLRDSLLREQAGEAAKQSGQRLREAAARLPEAVRAEAMVSWGTVIGWLLVLLGVFAIVERSTDGVRTDLRAEIREVQRVQAEQGEGLARIEAYFETLLAERDADPTR